MVHWCIVCSLLQGFTVHTCTVPNDITGTRLLMGRRVEMEILTESNPKPKGIWQETAFVCKNRR